MLYPNSTPEFQMLEKADGVIILQVRYVNITQGYKSKWQAIPVIKESLQAEETSTTI